MTPRAGSPVATRRRGRALSPPGAPPGRCYEPRVMAGRQVLLTGATGFVGRHVRPALEGAGWRVRCLSRDAARARRRWPGLAWIEGDVGDPRAARRALDGCDAALYLVHGIGEGDDFGRREVAAARVFVDAAAAVGVGRIVYLGGIAPAGPPSAHLRARLDVGEVLRGGAVSTIELRASMIVGHGSLSWLTVRDLAARLPAMILPRWLRSRTEPVAIDDVVVALQRALDLALDGSACFDIPGPEALSGREILAESAAVLGHRPPVMVDVPLLTPYLSSLWLRLVTRARWSIARELIAGLTDDVLARDDRFWGLVGHPSRLGFAEAARRALAAEDREGAGAEGPWGLVERVLSAT